ncbi:LOW QUALITY PROTEIN: DEAD-box ATP-dependent DNA helicase Fancm-like [Glossina fuscipes fuscipes]
MTATKNESTDAGWHQMKADGAKLQSLLEDPLPANDTSRLRADELFLGFDNTTGDTWIYPSNMPCRSYQLSMTQAALYRNTLIVLPTGLGKTFIAAVVMYNLYRWYPRGKVIFMAPTRPLVNQQIEACKNIMPFPPQDTVELTGKLAKPKRTELWQSKRVFFVTPQVVQSDMFGDMHRDSSAALSLGQESNFPFKDIKLVVVDEAHKAKGRYAYTEVVQAIARQTKCFRVLALSATPGRTQDDVAEVCRNLLISHLEVRWDNSIDVSPYVHKRHMQTVVVSLGEQIQEIRENLLLIIDPYLRQLIEAEVLSGHKENINRNFLLYEQKRFRERSLRHGNHPLHATVNSNFSTCISLYHALELLERHGLRVFLNNFEEDEDGNAKYVLQMDFRLKSLVQKIKQQVGPNPFEVSAGVMTNGQIAEMPKDLDFGHPKFEKARECLLKHFQVIIKKCSIIPYIFVPITKGWGSIFILSEHRNGQKVFLETPYKASLISINACPSACLVNVGPNPFEVSAGVMTNGQIAEMPKDLDFGHPKFEKARECLLKHFQEQENSRAMVFCEYRESVLLIYRMLLQEKPLLKPRCFVGQGGSSGGLRAFTQKQQIQIMNDFRSGKSNILIATSIGEEGIDVGEVDLIICFDISSANPTRFIQRIGRTGRQRNGKVVMLVTEGREQKLLKDVMATKDQLNKKLLRSQIVKQSLYQHSQRLVPPEFTPTCVRSFIKPIEKELKEFKVKKTKTTPNAKGKVNQDLRKYFNSKTCEEDKAMEFFQLDPTPKETKPGSYTQQCMQKKYERIKDLFKDFEGALTTNARKCEENPLPSIPLNEEMAESQVKNIGVDPKHTSKINKFLKIKQTSRGVLLRAEITDLAQHLKSPEMSNEMKIALLELNPKFIEQNLENMKILNALGVENEEDVSPEEKSVREINEIILNLLGGDSKSVENFLYDLELKEIREQCTKEDMKKFKQKIDRILKPFDNQGLCCDNYDYLMAEFRKTSRYQELLEQKNSDIIKGQSLAYDTVMFMDETTENSLEYSPSNSKYCKQWSEHIKSESTPLSKEKPIQSYFIHQTNSKKETRLPIEQAKQNKGIKNGSQEKLSLSPILAPKRTANVSSLPSVSRNYEFIDNSVPQCNDNDVSAASSKATKNSFHQELDMDLEAFLYPFQSIEQTTESKAAKNDIKANEFTKTQSKPSKEAAEVYSLPSDRCAFIDNSIPQWNAASIEASKISLQQELNVDLEAFLDPFQSIEHPKQSKASKSDIKSNEFTKIQLKQAFINSQEKRNLSPIAAPKEAANDYNSSSDGTNCEFIDNTIPQRHDISAVSSDATQVSLQQELDVDLEAFLEPFPEEELLLQKQLSKKEIASPSHCDSLKKPDNQSPDLFSLSSSANSPGGKIQRSTPQRILKALQGLTPIDSPPRSINTKQMETIEKSPSLFEMYLKSTRGKGKIRLHESPRPSIAAIGKDTSVIRIPQNRERALSKRKIFDSDEEVPTRKELTAIDCRSNDDTESDLEEIPATQMPRRNRRRFNCFIMAEAAVSGPETSQDEDESATDRYVLDSMIVASDEENENAHSSTHTKAMYLRSLKSPIRQQGAFKIPAPRVYDDDPSIFSQPLSQTCSQYISDSFVVDDNLAAETSDQTLCPLEKAEKLLEAKRRKGKRKYATVVDINPVPKKRRIRTYVIDDNTSEEEV